MPESRVLVVGGGAAGLCAAIAAARLGADVTVLEADARVGRKILVSGNGRCNLTNLAVLPSAFNHPVFVQPVIGTYPCEAIRAFFGEMGLLTRADEEGRVYPATNFAGSVLDVLRLECGHLGVELRCGFRAVHLAGTGTTGFEVSSADGNAVRADAVVVTTGGGGSLLTECGHTTVEGTPVLGPIKTDVEPIRGLSGVRVRCAATLVGRARDDGSGGSAVATERGELLFRDYGVSGIMIFDLSRYLVPGAVISIDLFPEIARDELQTMLEKRCIALDWRTADTLFAGMLHDRVARAIMRAGGVSAHTPAGQLPVELITTLLKDFRLKCRGIGDASQAQVTRGGASVSEFDPDSMASRRVDGLFAAGEVLDVDSRSGGFNLHWAWASGIVAGQNAARVAAERVPRRGGGRGGTE